LGSCTSKEGCSRGAGAEHFCISQAAKKSKIRADSEGGCRRGQLLGQAEFPKLAFLLLQDAILLHTHAPTRQEEQKVL
jgi:hypothetical protein